LILQTSRKNRFDGKTVLITGAGRGIGKTIASWFAREGADVAINDVRKVDLDNTVSELKDYPSRIVGYLCDVSKEAQVQKMVESVIREFHQIDILVNNAGIALPTSLFELSEDEWDKVLGINLKGAFLVSRSVLRYMKDRKYGKIIMMASIAGKTGGITTGLHYDVSGGGRETFPVAC
jgi:3-oxoacyl-[acyl-carrier protein] reductase